MLHAAYMQGLIVLCLRQGRRRRVPSQSATCPKSVASSWDVPVSKASLQISAAAWTERMMATSRVTASEFSGFGQNTP